ncbi:MAG: epoxyqueuosine reductase [Clostridia bacterium]|nr:epoxyqueuosine reductase [Clostridia bacterium]
MNEVQLCALAEEKGFRAVYILAPSKVIKTVVNRHNEKLIDDPKDVLSAAKSVIVLIMPYKPYEKAAEDGKGAMISAYYPASQRAYIAAREIRDEIEKQGYQAASNAQLPMKPLLIKYGIGKMGRNSLVSIPGFGTRFHVQAIVTDIPFERKMEPLKEDAYTVLDEKCRSCNRCVQACPTGAIGENGEFDAEKCLRCKDEGVFIPEDMREKFGNRLFGCDECQNACIRNRINETGEMEEALSESLVLTKLLSGDMGELSMFIGRNYARKTRIRMKSAIVAGNLKRQDALEYLKDMLKSGTETEQIYAKWAIERIEGA